MSSCPKCGFAVEAGAVDCPACGIVIAKYRPPVRPVAAAPPRLPPVPGALDEPVGSPSAPFELPAAASASAAELNPYAPPAAPATVAAPPRPVAAAGSYPVSDTVVAALQKARPWMTFLAIYGFVTLGMMILGGLGVLVAGMATDPRMMPIGLIYFLYALVGMAFVLPLHRAAAALRGLEQTGPATALEGYVVETTSFWRRTGILSVAMLGLIAVGIGLAVLFGAIAAMSR